jgi:hypothetical protein
MSKTTTRSVIIAGKTVIITGVPVDASDDVVKSFALIKLHQMYKKKAQRELLLLRKAS